MYKDYSIAGIAIIVVLFAIACTILWFAFGWVILWGVDRLGYTDEIDVKVFKTVWLAIYAAGLAKCTASGANKGLED